VNPELTPEDKRLIEREFVARQEATAKRRSRMRVVFAVGISAGVAAAALREFRIPTLVSPFLWFVWLLSVAMYVGLGVFPGSLAKDMDPRWHLNPWQEALKNLSEGRTQIEAIALLAGPMLARLLFSFLHFGLK
jgi:hypothetical protein